MDDYDFNLSNYELDDILNLFQVPYNFGKEELKGAKKKVLQAHPDKSGLSKDYFLFFSKAYKTLYQIYTFRNKTTNQSTEYVCEDDAKEEKELLLNDMKGKKNFNALFNKMFEKHKIHDDSVDTGYGDWLKSNDDIDDRKVSFNEMKDVIDEKKANLKSLIVSHDIEEGGNINHYELDREKPMEYSSDLFSNLNYEDLKKAHTETVVPVTHEDYVNKKKFSNVEEMRSFRNEQQTRPLSLDQAKNYLTNRENMQAENDVRRAYKLAQQDEIAKDINKKWWGQLKRITQ